MNENSVCEVLTSDLTFHPDKNKLVEYLGSVLPGPSESDEEVQTALDFGSSIESPYAQSQITPLTCCTAGGSSDQIYIISGQEIYRRAVELQTHRLACYVIKSGVCPVDELYFRAAFSPRQHSQRLELVLPSYLVKSYNWSPGRISTVLGRSLSWVVSRLQLMEFSAILRTPILDGRISLPVGLILNRIQAPQVLGQVVREAQLGRWNVRKAEMEIEYALRLLLQARKEMHEEIQIPLRPQDDHILEAPKSTEMYAEEFTGTPNTEGPTALDPYPDHDFSKDPWGCHLCRSASGSVPICQPCFAAVTVLIENMADVHETSAFASNEN